MTDVLHRYGKLIVVFAFVSLAIIFSFQGRSSTALDGLIGGVALVEAFVIFNYESRMVSE